MADRNLHRLPIDVWASDRRPPDLSAMSGTVEEYAARRADAVEGGDFKARAEALWGLVARGDESLDWCRRALEDGDPDRLGDACGVLAWIGTPPEVVSLLQRLLAELPDGEARDCVYEVLPETARGENDAAADGAPAGEDLLEGSFAPFTNLVWYVEAPLEDAVRARGLGRPAAGPPPYRHPALSVGDWLQAKVKVALGLPDPLSPNTPAKTYEAELRGPLPELLARLEPFAMPSWKSLWVQTRGGWTAVFSQGSDLSYVADYARRLHTRVLRTSYHPDLKRAARIVSHGDCSFWLFDGRREDLAPGYQLRTIQASRQSGWDWHESGEVQPFEETQRYAARRIAERFDLAMLNRYCSALGIHRNDPAFYGPEAVLEELDRKRWRRPPRTLSGAEWRAQHDPRG